MNENPIWRKETLLFNRGLFLPLLISFTNLILLILFISNLYYISLNGLQTGEIRYSAFFANILFCGSWPFSSSAPSCAGNYSVRFEYGRRAEYA